MRMRKRAHLPERILCCQDYILDTKEELSAFAAGRKLHLEIGCGKGKFITETAEKAPDVPHLAVEICENVAILAAERAMEMGLCNLRFSMKDIKLLDEVIEDGSVSRIYLNFSDPWPKKKQAKRRLTHESFLKLYARGSRRRERSFSRPITGSCLSTRSIHSAPKITHCPTSRLIFTRATFPAIS